MSSNKIIDRKIATFITNRDKLKNLGHEIAMMIFDHANEHGDCTRAIKLAKALPNSWQPQMEAWFKAFSPIRVVIKNDKCEFDPAFKKSAIIESARTVALPLVATEPYYFAGPHYAADNEFLVAFSHLSEEAVGEKIEKFKSLLISKAAP